jgi:glycosyltransferase involved in cell wall biosynthesis
LRAYVGFLAGAFFKALRLPKPDVLLVESTPPLVVLAGAAISFLRRLPLVHVVQDLYPEVAEALGVIRRGGVLAWLLRRIHRLAIGRAGGVIVLGRDMRAILVRDYSLEKARVTVIPNWADLAALTADEAAVAALKAHWGIAGKTVVMYSGNLGRAHTFDEVLSVAERWKGRPDVVFLFVGGGAHWDAVAGRARVQGLDNVVVKPYQERERLGVSLAVANVHLITQKAETLGLMVPSKLYGVLAVSRPVVFVGPAESEVALTLTETGSGKVVSPGDADALETALRGYVEDPQSARRAGSAGRRWMEAQGDRKFRTAKYAEILRAAVERR